MKAKRNINQFHNEFKTNKIKQSLAKIGEQLTKRISFTKSNTICMKKSPIHEFLKPTITLSNNCIVKSVHGKFKFKNVSAKDFSNAHEALLSNLMTAVKTNTLSYLEKKVNEKTLISY